MSSADLEANKALYFRFITLLGEDNLDALDELLAPAFVDPSLPQNAQSGVRGLKEHCASLRECLPPIRVTLEDLIAAGDRIVGRVVLHGAASSGRIISIEFIDIVRIAAGRIAERWSHHGACELSSVTTQTLAMSSTLRSNP